MDLPWCGLDWIPERRGVAPDVGAAGVLVCFAALYPGVLAATFRMGTLGCAAGRLPGLPWPALYRGQWCWRGSRVQRIEHADLALEGVCGRGVVVVFRSLWRTAEAAWAALTAGFVGVGGPPAALQWGPWVWPYGCLMVLGLADGAGCGGRQVSTVISHPWG